MTLPLALCFLAVAAVTLLGDWFLKKASLATDWALSPFLAAGLLLYMVSGLGIVFAMRHMTLASVGVWYSVLTVLFMAALGVFAFGETLTAREGAGILLALAALACMARLA